MRVGTTGDWGIFMYIQEIGLEITFRNSSTCIAIRHRFFIVC